MGQTERLKSLFHNMYKKMKTKHRFLALGLHYKLYEQREASVRFFEILLDIIIHKVVSILEEDMLCLGVARMDDF